MAFMQRPPAELSAGGVVAPSGEGNRPRIPCPAPISRLWTTMARRPSQPGASDLLGYLTEPWAAVATPDQGVTWQTPSAARPSTVHTYAHSWRPANRVLGVPSDPCEPACSADRGHRDPEATAAVSDRSAHQGAVCVPCSLEVDADA